MEFVKGSVIVPDLVRASMMTISEGELTNTEAIASPLFVCGGFWGGTDYGDGGQSLKGWVAGRED